MSAFSFSHFRKGFTLIELLIVISLISTLLVISLKTFSYFSANMKLSEAKEVVDTTLVTANTNALTGKSEASDHYGLINSDHLLPSRYFLYFKNIGTWEEENKIIYGELQEDTDNKGYFKLIYVKPILIPLPVFLQSMTFTASEERADAEIISKDLFLFFDPPFGNVQFLPDGEASVIKLRSADDLAAYKDLYEVTDSDYRINPLEGYDGMTLDLKGKTLKKGQIEIALQYKDREELDDNNQTKEGYWLREYIKYDSRNQLSHYWE